MRLVERIAQGVYRAYARHRAAYITWETLPPHLRAIPLEQAEAALAVVEEHHPDLARVRALRAHAGAEALVHVLQRGALQDPLDDEMRRLLLRVLEGESDGLAE